MDHAIGTFTFIDLFAGIGGFHQALSELGGRCVMASEIDEAARSAYQRNFPRTQLYGDILPLTEPDVARAIPEHDVLCAGFPCQPFSKSGYQRGMDETRGTLFFSILKILEARRPQFALLENVRNLAGPRQRHTWKTIIRSLRELGYRVSGQPAVLTPHHLPREAGGRPQVRDRVFILCEHVGAGAPLDRHPLVERSPMRGWDPNGWDIHDFLDPDDEIPDLSRYSVTPDEVRWINAWNDFSQSIEDGQLPGFPIWVDAFTRRPVYDHDTPAWKAAFLERNSEFYRQHQRTIDRWRRKHDVQSFPLSRRKFEWQARRHQPTADSRNLWDLVMHLRPSGLRVKAPTYLPALVAITQTSIIGSRRRRLTPREAARLQGFPDSFTLHPSDAAAYRQLGNAVNVGVVQHAARALFESSTMSSGSRDGALAFAPG